MAECKGTLKQLRTWVSAEIETGEPADAKTLASRAARHFRADPEFCTRFLDENLRAFIYEEIVAFIGRNRQLAATQMRRLAAADIATAIEDAASGDESPWAKWLEYDPGSGTYIPLLDLTREQGLAAVQYRQERVNAELHNLEFVRLVVGKLKAGQRVRDVWTEEELADIKSRIIIGRTKVTLGPPGARETILDVMKRNSKEAA